jgi:cystine transport system substrate-binding protein
VVPATVLTALLLAVAVPVVAGAAPSKPSTRPPSAPTQSGSLAAQAQRAVLDLYALEARLRRAREELAGAAARQAEVERQRSATARYLAVARTAASAAEERLGELVRALYQQTGATEPLEIVLGASSLDEALARLDGLDRAAAQSAEIIGQARASRLRLRAAEAELLRRAGELRRLATAARKETEELAAAVAERQGYIRDLRRRQELDAARIANATARARTAATRTVAPVSPPREAAPSAFSAPAASSAPAPAAAAPVRAGIPGATLTVTSTGYILRGVTASGLPTGRGVVAVDPSVIPLGTRMTVPGYGEAIAADTGGAVIGNTIDLWFATLEEAERWGRRTVTITIQ